jgi:hypothetical protein
MQREEETETKDVEAEEKIEAEGCRDRRRNRQKDV